MGDEAPLAVQISLLGGFRVQVAGSVLGPRQVGGSKPRRLLIALALARGAPVSKDRLVSMLWDAGAQGQSTANIETYVSLLRKHLPTAGPAREGPIATGFGSYSLDLGRVDVDVVALAEDMSWALDASITPETALPVLRRTLAKAQLPLLPEEFEARWLEDARREHERQTGEWLVAAAEKVLAIAPREGAQWARRAIEADPLDEGAWYAYLRCKEVAGQYAEGLRAYDICRRQFSEELGCAPGPRLQGIYARLLGDSFDADQDLEQLIAAVIRLHGYAVGEQVGDPIASRDGRPRLSVDQARRALVALLRRAPMAPATGLAAPTAGDAVRSHHRQPQRPPTTVWRIRTTHEAGVQ
ncbi:hypothetical protein UB45_10600 [Terrabacter sp. 28]|nr:hypothetical protein UB45_10600 [Terrabacter sp. 28]